MPNNDDIPAFPSMKPLESWGDPHKGMSLRDWFAGQALAGMRIDAPGTKKYETAMEEACVDKAYRIADLMLQKRKE